jgi:hypothetical protein
MPRSIVRQTVVRPVRSKHGQNIGFQLAALPAVKILIDHEGWYRVSQPQLTAAGLPPNVDARSLHLYAEGVEQPIRITGAGAEFGPGSAIEFYGSAIDTPYSGQRVYWLTAQSGPGSRIPELRTGAGSGAPEQSFVQTIELKPRTTYFAALLRGDTDNFFGPLISPTEAALNFEVSNIAAGQASVTLSLQGVTDNQQHDVTVNLNGATLGEVQFNGQEIGRATFDIPAGALTNGTNAITLTAELGANDLSLVDYIDVSFPHALTAEADVLKFSGSAGENITVSGFTHPPTRLLDITNANQPLLLRFQTAGQGGQYSLSASIPWSSPGAHTLLALSDIQIGAPAGLVPHSPSNLHRTQPGAQAIVITNRQFAAQMAPLVQLHESRGISVALVGVDDIYDEFNFGEPSPDAVKDFLLTATEAWKKRPKYLLLAGDASVDPRNYLGFGSLDFVPTKVVTTAELKTASDDWFSDFNNTGFPTMATGRLPARTAADAQGMVSKIIGYESNAPASWANNAMLVADTDDTFINFSQQSLGVQNMLPSTMTVSHVFAGELGPGTAKQDLLTGIQEGQLLVNYDGHGSVETWSGSDLLDDTIASSLTNGGRLPVFLVMNCLNGFFHDVYTESLAESLMLAPNGGAVAVWASSGLTAPSPQFQMDQTLVRTLFAQPSITLGDAVLYAKSLVGDQDVRRTFVLFGDPLMQLKRPSSLGQISTSDESAHPRPTPHRPDRRVWRQSRRSDEY